MRVLSTLLVIVVCSSVCFAEMIVVPDDFETIQEAVNEAENGDTVLVEPGEYFENLNIPPRQLFIASRFIFDHDVEIIDETIIDGGGNGNTVSILNFQDINLILEGFTIRGADGSGIFCRSSAPILRNLVVVDNNGDNNGGGISLYHSSAIIENTRIAENSGVLGGGINITGSEVMISGCIIEANQAYNGGGILVYQSFGQLTDVILRQNDAEVVGGGMRIESQSQLSLLCVAAIDNSAGVSGGGIEVSHDSNVLMSVMTICGNTGERGGGGLEIRNESLVTLTNCIHWGNDDAEIEDINMLTSTFSDFQEAVDGNGNVIADPLFVDPDNGDYRLTPDSPCIDAGDPLAGLDPDGTRSDMGAFYFHQRDIEVEPDVIEFNWVQRGEYDSLAVVIRNIGLTRLQITVRAIVPDDAPFVVVPDGEVGVEPESEQLVWIFFLPEAESDYEAIFRIESDDPDEAVIEISVSGTSLGVADKVVTAPSEFRITGVYPNPFNATTVIGFDLAFTQRVSLRLFDLSGQLVNVLTEDRYTAGGHSIIINAANLPSGVYIARLESQSEAYAVKVVLVR